MKPFGTLFAIIFVMQIIGSFSYGSLAFIDTATIRKSQLSKNRKVEYGMQRTWAAPGAMFGNAFANLIIEHFPFKQVTCGAGLFIPFGVFTILTMVLLMFLYKDLDFKDNQENLKSTKTTTTIICGL